MGDWFRELLFLVLNGTFWSKHEPRSLGFPVISRQCGTIDSFRTSSGPIERKNTTIVIVFDEKKTLSLSGNCMKKVLTNQTDNCQEGRYICTEIPNRKGGSHG